MFVISNLITADRIEAPYDAILLTVKAFSLEAALDDLAPAVGPETMILPVLNGMKHVDALIARFGRQAVAGCVCKVATIVDDQGRIVQLNTLQDLAYGEMSGLPSARTDALDKLMQGVGFDARLSRTIELEMWQKWIQLSSLGALTCLMRGTVGETEAVPGGADTANQILRESTSIATACGHPPREDFLSKARSTLTTRGSNLTSSMYRDLVKGARVEADQIIGDLLDRGHRLGVETPLLQAAYVNLKIYEGRLSTPKPSS